MRECVAFVAIHNLAYIKLYNSKLLRFHNGILKGVHHYRLLRHSLCLFLAMTEE
ncbi:hypothetical protein [Helicobacter rodentium]|uniref:hypothetical protein n=1 Tax=Helicobacter rodentium TaxID=59617 RepID=UPI0023EFBA7C|nr:hypothetical protein [Helicobacter rodentium]